MHQTILKYLMLLFCYDPKSMQTQQTCFHAIEFTCNTQLRCSSLLPFFGQVKGSSITAVALQVLKQLEWILVFHISICCCLINKMLC